MQSVPQKSKEAEDFMQIFFKGFNSLPCNVLLMLCCELKLSDREFILGINLAAILTHFNHTVSEFTRLVRSLTIQFQAQAYLKWLLWC
ncbi:hypothetical protein NPIL_181361 [Nephila pilipes]|uniref:Uncharacterized protein n=1 Tax=Nephila pilipes TaxID=299642 RepID=A0A8X6U9F4_NEPPI|nr:hypothetical protein NPIL_181361 [Nephila pilipes]